MKRVTPQESIAEAMRWVSRITNIGLSVAVPTLAGYGIDRWQGTFPWGAVVGGAVGGVIALQQVVLLARSLSAEDDSSRRSQKP